jgi:uncharacterized membrane protein YhaH (DUF805 family)|tara:strand:- start:409 stop:885 length:477 start_codon:yes stop_codon:yes gene_type:complete
MFCSQCGSANDSYASFCKECGESLTDYPQVANSFFTGEVTSRKMVSFKEAIRLGLENCLNSNGRATRAEYLWYQLFLCVLLIPALIGDAIFGGFGILTLLWFLFAVASGFMLTVRRLHDFGRSGWTMLWAIVPFVELILMGFLVFKRSDKGTNKYDLP